MPIWDFTCAKCGYQEEDVLLARNGVERSCPTCGSRMKRKPNGFNPVFKGDGWTEKSYPTGAKHD